MSLSMAEVLKSFSDPQAVAKYTDGPVRFVPGFADLHRMTGILLGEHTPADARVLVLGAGGGLELRALAEMHSGWTFEGVDPAAEMLKLAAKNLGPLAERVHFVEGYIQDATDGPFDAAACLLTLHFLEREERKQTLSEIVRRMKPGAPFVAAHSSFPQGDTRALWLDRYAAFAVASGADPQATDRVRAAVDQNLSLLSPQEDEAVLREAGFKDVTPFYSAFTWRGWVARA